MSTKYPFFKEGWKILFSGASVDRFLNCPSYMSPTKQGINLLGNTSQSQTKKIIAKTGKRRQ
jgi:hypothetical protein